MAIHEATALAAVTQSIVEYLREHPHAADTVEGIRTWWLPAALAGSTPEAVRTCVEQLAREERMRRRVLSDGTEIYGGVTRETALRLHPGRTKDNRH